MISKLFLLTSSLTLYLATVVLVPIYRHYALSKGILDVASPRSSHQGIIPRGGGIIFITLWMIYFLLGYWLGLFEASLILLFLPGSLLISFLGYWDDKASLSPKLRLLGQLLTALLFLAVLGKIDTLHLFNLAGKMISLSGSVWLMSLLLILGIVWSINLFNFMDGIDGLASLEALFVLGVGGFIFWLSLAPSLALLAWSIVVVVAGFLVWNWPRANIFMGDAGSYCLGFLIAAFAIIGAIWYQIPIALWLILYALFWFDATVTLLRRLYLKQHWATAHRDHAYQRLLQAGFSHGQVLGIAMLINTLLAGLAIWGYHKPTHLLWPFCSAILLVGLWYLWAERLYPHQKGAL